MGIRLRSGVSVAAALGLVATIVAVGPVASAASSGDQAIASAGLLTASDLPAGWTSHPQDRSGDRATQALAGKIPPCKAYLALQNASRRGGRVAARSPEFESNGSTFDNSVYVFPSTAVASARVREFKRSQFGSCANRLFEQLLMKERVQGSTGATKVRTVDANVEPYAIENYADDTVSYEGPLRVTLADGETMTFGLGLTAIRSARAIALYSYFIADQSAQASLAPALESSVQRLVDAIGTHT